MIENLVDGIGLEVNTDNPQNELFCCKCKHNNGEPCCTHFDAQELQSIRLGFLELSRDELDIAILAKLSCGMHLTASTTKSRKKAEAQRTDFFYHGFKICRDTFRYIHNISQDKLNNLMRHYKEHGVQARVHKNSKRKPHNALSLVETRAVVDFILNFAEANAIVLPGRAPGHWKTDVKLLPTNCSKKKVYDSYC